MTSVSYADALSYQMLSAEQVIVDVSWRGDGQLVAVSVREGTEQGSLLIFECPSLKLSTTAEKKDDTVGCVAWQPNGRHLYAATVPSPQDLSRLYLFENNGLVCGSFLLRHPGIDQIIIDDFS